MDDKAKEALQARREKISRVHRMKSMIVFTLFLWVVISLLLMIFLSVKVVLLEKDVNSLKNVILSSSGSKISEKVNTKMNQTDQELLMQNSAEDNLAGANDTLKVYLTFDDGPSNNTDRILDTLDDYNVKATFFVNGRTDHHSKKMYKRIVKEGHTLGMHSYTHKYSEVYASLASFKKDFEKIQNLLYDVTGVVSTYYRFPGGSSNKVSNSDMSEFIKYLNQQDITYFDWNVMCGDATTSGYTRDELVENVMKDVVKYKTSVVLMHDATDKDATVEALPTLIEKLQQKGALLLPISEDTTLIQHVSLSSK
ncbi:Peptidoglycan/xylan/chitin deacetylase, PgdA/CDA1 family [Lachnospiraceae bacterium KHCPX20]|nr:Peptidoglycan/xylan/chitin deacetylase, PgdA/CDA1 family [Lachnospiraceae bacterium KHCPX20]